jgi:hypothetical protein
MDVLAKKIIRENMIAGKEKEPWCANFAHIK